MPKATESYKRVWVMLFLGWTFAYIDRTLTGPVVTWMIENKVAFLGSAATPHALGGLLGSLFFAGYMLTQFPGGYFGDKFGYRTVIVISITWAGIMTLLTGLTGGLVAFIALRVLTGLGEGVWYSNDRSLVAQVTPPQKLGFGLGFVMGGLGVGLTAGIVGTIYVIDGAKPFLGNDAWKAPFLVLGLVTLAVAWLIKANVAPRRPGVTYPYGKALWSLLKYSTVFFVLIMGVYFLTARLGLSDVGIAVFLTSLALLLIAFIYGSKAREIRPILKDRNLLLLYLSAIPILWHLWFYGFWSVAVVKEFGGGALGKAALVASFNGVAGLIGFPLGGKISDMVAGRPNGRRNVLVLMTLGLTVLVCAFAGYLMAGQKNLVVMSAMLLASGLLFFALQSVNFALTAEAAPAELRGAAFGMWNLIAEIGAVLSPVVSGALRDATGSWGAPLFLDAALIGASAVVVMFVSTVPAPSVMAALDAAPE
jgi:MFS family permease